MGRKAHSSVQEKHRKKSRQHALDGERCEGGVQAVLMSSHLAAAAILRPAADHAILQSFQIEQYTTSSLVTVDCGDCGSRVDCT
jgi:hypothetical protein